MTYDDVTNIDSVGLITARSGIKVTSGSIVIGSNSDLQIYHNPSTNHSYIDETGSGNLYIRNGSKNSIFARTDGEVILYNNDSNKLETTESGVIVSGVCTATSFVGSGASLTDLPAGGNSADFIADGTIPAATPVIVTSAGKAKAVEQVVDVANPPSCSNQGGSRLYFSSAFKHLSSDYGADTPNNSTTGLTLNCWRENDGYVRGRFTSWQSDTILDSGWSTTTISSSGDCYDTGIKVRYIGGGYWLVMWCTGIGFNPGSDRMKCRTVHHNGDLGVENTMSATVAYGANFEAVRISDTTVSYTHLTLPTTPYV